MNYEDDVFHKREPAIRSGLGVSRALRRLSQGWNVEKKRAGVLAEGHTEFFVGFVIR